VFFFSSQSIPIRSLSFNPRLLSFIPVLSVRFPPTSVSTLYRLISFIRPSPCPFRFFDNPLLPDSNQHVECYPRHCDVSPPSQQSRISSQFFFCHDPNPCVLFLGLTRTTAFSFFSSASPHPAPVLRSDSILPLSFLFRPFWETPPLHLEWCLKTTCSRPQSTPSHFPGQSSLGHCRAQNKGRAPPKASPSFVFGRRFSRVLHSFLSRAPGLCRTNASNLLPFLIEVPRSFFFSSSEKAAFL